MSIHNSQIQIKPVYLVLQIFPQCGSLIHCSAKWLQVVVKKDLTTQIHSNPWIFASAVPFGWSFLSQIFVWPALTIQFSIKLLLPWRGIFLANEPLTILYTSCDFIISQHVSLPGVISVHLVITCPSTGMWFQKARGLIRQAHCSILTTYAVWRLTVDW